MTITTHKLAVVLMAAVMVCLLIPVPTVVATEPVPVCGEYLMNDLGDSRMEMTEDKLGVAFRFNLCAFNVTMDDHHVLDLSNATVRALDEFSVCRLVQVGAIVTNDPEIGLRLSRMNHDNLSDYTKDVPAVYASEIVSDGEYCYLRYAVRVTNIPTRESDAVIYARPYYIYENDGVQNILYGDIVYTNYDDRIDTNDGIFEW